MNYFNHNKAIARILSAMMVLLTLAQQSAGAAQTESETVDLASQLELIAESVKRLASDGERTPDASIGRPSTHDTSILYREPMSRKLPYESIWLNSDSALQNDRLHCCLANARECARGLAMAQTLFTKASEYNDARMALKHLDAGLYFAWRGREQIRMANQEMIGRSDISRATQQAMDGVALNDEVWTRLCYEWAAALEKLSQTRITLEVSAPTAKKLQGWLPLPAGAPVTDLIGKQPLAFGDDSLSAPLIPVAYDIYLILDQPLQNDLLPVAFRLHQAVNVGFGETTKLKCDELTERTESAEPAQNRGGLRIELGDKIELPYRWFVIPHDSNWSTITAQTEEDSGSDRMLIEPGKYDVYWIETSSHRYRPMLLARGVHVQSRQWTIIDLTCGVELETPEWIEFNFEGHWGVVRSGESPWNMVNWSTQTAGKVLSPPGSYDVYWIQGNHYRPMLLAENIIVKPDGLTKVSATSGIRLEVADWVPEFGYDGRWGVASAGTKPDELMHWSNSPGNLLLPAGKYDVYWQQDTYRKKPLLLAYNVQVMEGGLAIVRANSGIQLEVAEWVPQFGYDGHWGAVPAGAKPDEMVYWSKSLDEILLPAGYYDVYWRQSIYHKIPLLLAAKVRVEQGSLKTIQVNSGIQLDVADWVPKFGYDGRWGVVQSGANPETLLHWSSTAWQLVLPTGRYDVYWKQSSSHKSILLQADVAVVKGAKRVDVKPEEIKK